MTTPKALREMCEEVLKETAWKSVQDARYKTIARAHIALLDRLSGEAVTRDVIYNAITEWFAVAVKTPNSADDGPH